MYKTFKMRLFPTKFQEYKLYQHIDACRFVWNYMVEQNYTNHDATGKFLSHFTMCNMLVELKRDNNFYWLNHVAAHSLQAICRDVAFAFSWYCQIPDRGKPKFKSKKYSKKSFPLRQDKHGIYLYDDQLIQIPKIGKVKYKLDYRHYKFNLNKLFNIANNPRILLMPNHKWILVFDLECENQAPQIPYNGNLGIDVGIKEAATYSFETKNKSIKSEVFHNINKSSKVKKLKSKIMHTRKSLDRKRNSAHKFGYDPYSSKSYVKELEKHRRLWYKWRMLISNEYQKETSRLIYDIRPSAIIMENVSIANLMKNHHLAKSIAECSWYRFKLMIEYKCGFAGIPLIIAPTNFPSTKMCSRCGSIKPMKLSERKYKCPVCGLIIDRDINASINLMQLSD